MLVALPGAVVLCFFGPRAMQVFGANFHIENMNIMILLMSLSVAVEAIGIGLYQLIQCHEKMWASFFFISLPRDMILTLSAYFLTGSYGATGLAGAVLIGHSSAFVAILSIIFKKRLFHNI
jgi:hypothetical protein